MAVGLWSGSSNLCKIPNELTLHFSFRTAWTAAGLAKNAQGILGSNSNMNEVASGNDASPAEASFTVNTDVLAS